MNKYIPRFLFHEDCREGKIFKDADSINQAKAEGWVEGPHLIQNKGASGRPPEPPKSGPELPPEPLKADPKKRRGPSKGKR